MKHNITILNIDKIISSLHSKEGQLSFLNSIYTPGNTDIADKILALDNNSLVIKKEISHAKSTGNTNRYETLAKKFIDNNLLSNVWQTLSDEVIAWNDPELANYAIAKINALPEEDWESVVGESIRIAEAFGKTDVVQENLENRLAFQKKEKHPGYILASTLEKLGRFDEAIDNYLAVKMTFEAFEIAKKHSPERLNTIAKIGFKEYYSISHSAEFYAECAKQIGKTKKAITTLSKYVDTEKLEPHLSYYKGIVTALISLGQDVKAKELVSKLYQHDQKIKESGKTHDFNRLNEMAELYHAIGDIDTVKNIYTQIIDRSMSKGYSSTLILENIKEAIEFTGDESFKERELDVFEREKEYHSAAKLAIELKKPELAKTYETMAKLVENVKALGGK